MEGHQAKADSHGISWTDTWSNSALLIVILRHIYNPGSWYPSPVVPNQVRSVQIQRRLCVWGAQGQQKLWSHWGVMQALSEMSAGCKAGSWHSVLAEELLLFCLPTHSSLTWYGAGLWDPVNWLWQATDMTRGSQKWQALTSFPKLQAISGWMCYGF